MKLSIWMIENDMDDKAFAKRMGVSIYGVQKWRLGVSVPRATQLLKILEITAGEVTPNDFFWKYISKVGRNDEKYSND
jgi:DNA-binding transcriptional regulator YdaS (Cro superfamily)